MTKQQERRTSTSCKSPQLILKPPELSPRTEPQNYRPIDLSTTTPNMKAPQTHAAAATNTIDARPVSDGTRGKSSALPPPPGFHEYADGSFGPMIGLCDRKFNVPTPNGPGAAATNNGSSLELLEGSSPWSHALADEWSELRGEDDAHSYVPARCLEILRKALKALGRVREQIGGEDLRRPVPIWRPWRPGGSEGFERFVADVDLGRQLGHTVKECKLADQDVFVEVCGDAAVSLGGAVLAVEMLLGACAEGEGFGEFESTSVRELKELLLGKLKEVSGEVAVSFERFQRTVEECADTIESLAHP